jgi:hypothetical protein
VAEHAANAVYTLGLLAMISTFFVSSVISPLPFRLDLSHGTGRSRAWSLSIMIALGCFAFCAWRAGQPMFGRILRD